MKLPKKGHSPKAQYSQLIHRLLVLVRIASASEAEAVLTRTHNLYFEQKYEKYQRFLSEKFQFLEVKFSIYLNRRVFVMK